MKSAMKLILLAVIMSSSLSSCSEGESQALLGATRDREDVLTDVPLNNEDVPSRPPRCTKQFKTEIKWAVGIPVTLGVLYGIHELLVRYTNNVEN